MNIFESDLPMYTLLFYNTYFFVSIFFNWFSLDVNFFVLGFVNEKNIIVLLFEGIRTIRII